MSRWSTYLWRALAAMADAEYAYPYPSLAAERARHLPVDLRDDAAVRAAFRDIVEGEWGAGAWQRGIPER